MRKLTFSAVALAAVSLVVAGCAGGGTAAPGSSSQAASGGTDVPVVAFVAKVSNNPYYGAVEKGAEAAAKDLGAQITFTGPDQETEVDKQVNLLQNAVDKTPAALALAPLDPQAVLPPLQQAKSKGIPVIVFDTALEGSDIPTATVATDNYAAAQAAAQHFVELTGGKGKYAVVAHNQTSTTGKERRDGFIDYIKKNAPDMTLVTVQYSDSDQAKATNITASILQANPDLVGIYATNEQSAVGAASEVQVAQQQGRHIVMVGFDSGKAQNDLVRSGVISGSIAQNPYQMGYKTVQTALDVLAGKTVQSTIDSGFVWYTADNMDNADIKANLYE